MFNCTDDKTILPGFELLSINGRSIEEVSQPIKRQYWSDGFIELTKGQTLQGQRFDLFSYSIIERPDSFHFAFRSLTGDTVWFNTTAQTFGSSIKWIKDNEVNKRMAKWYNKRKESIHGV